MVVALSVGMTTDLVTSGKLGQIRREVNREAGRYIVDVIVTSKFTQSIKYDIPNVYQPRSKKYERWKLRKVGHNIPNVLTGRLKQYLPSDAKTPGRLTATQNGGKVKLRPYWSGAGVIKSNGKLRKSGFREAQRQEFEAIGTRQKARLSKRMETFFVEQINDPKNRRKRAVKQPKG